jgi:hypothetical protein
MNAIIQQYLNGKLREEKKHGDLDASACQLVLGFASRGYLENHAVYDQLRQQFNNADIITCSTSGEIFDENVLDESLVCTCLQFEKTKVKTYEVNVSDNTGSFELGKTLASKIDQDDLSYVFIISDGGLINGSLLVNGINEVIQSKVPVTGGLAGDADRFEKTLVGLNGKAITGKVVAIGFYGKSLIVRHGSLGGWDMFGPERTVTKSVDNVLYEIENKKVLELYKNYLGNYSSELPGSALLFPLSMKEENSENQVVRTILKIDEETQSMTFAGNIPIGSKVRFMKANFDRLVDAANAAAKQTKTKEEKSPAVAILISCVGRKLILNNRIEEEVEAVKSIYTDSTLISGFYSYGEISPFVSEAKCELHNQTMTITTFDEM